MLVGIGYLWCCAIASIQPLAEEPFCRFSIPLSCKEKAQGILILFNGSIHPLSLAFNLQVEFIHSPRMTGWTQVAATTLVQPGTVSLYPPVAGRMVNAQSAFCTHFFHISVAERIAAIPKHTPEDNCRQKMTLLERRLASQSETLIRSSNFLPYYEPQLHNKTVPRAVGCALEEIANGLGFEVVPQSPQYRKCFMRVRIQLME